MNGRTMRSSSAAIRRQNASLLVLLGCCCACSLLPQGSAFISGPSFLSTSGPSLLSSNGIYTGAHRAKSELPSSLDVDPPLICGPAAPGAARQLWSAPLIATSSIQEEGPTRSRGARGASRADLPPPWALVKTARVCGSMLAAFAAMRLISAGWGGASLPAATAGSHKFFQTGFYEAFALVSLSEIGDKSFFTAGLLALRTSRLAAFLGSFGALSAMTLVSVGIGRAFHAAQLPRFLGSLPLDGIATIVAFAYFGIKTLKEASAMDSSSEEQELAEADKLVSSGGGKAVSRTSSRWSQIAAAFGLIFAAEFGDRSFLATVALASAQDPIGVAWGATAAHALTTITAVWGASYVAKHVSEKMIHYVGGLLFILFAFTTAFGIF